MANFLMYLPIKHHAVWLPTAIKKKTTVNIIESLKKVLGSINIEIAVKPTIILLGFTNWNQKVFRKPGKRYQRGPKEESK